MNCTRVKSILEPFLAKKYGHMLLNPSISKSSLNVTSLDPATQYDCILIGAVAVYIGEEEKLTILSNTVSFVTEFGELIFLTLLTDLSI